MDSPRKIRAAAGPKRGRPTDREAPGKIARLMNVAIHEFEVNGFAGTSINQIARRSGVSRMTIYRRFGGKEQLFYEVALRSIEEIRADMRAIDTDGAPEDVLTRFAAQVIGTRTRTDSMQLLRIAIAAHFQFPDIPREVHRQSLETLAPLIDYLAGLAETGAIACEDPERAAQEFVINALGNLRFLLLGPEASNDPDEPRHIARKFLCGYGKGFG